MDFRYLVWFVVLNVPSLAFAQNANPRNGLIEQLIFWVGAAALVFLMSKSLFREQFHERRTARRLIDEIGPFYPDFDVDSIHRFVNQCAPDIWRAFELKSFDKVREFVVPDFQRDAIGPERRDRKNRRLQFAKILKLHPLGIYLVGGCKPPFDIELMLRLEEKVLILPAEGTVQSGEPSFTQVQSFWTLRYSRNGWCVVNVRPAKEDIRDLAERPKVPDVRTWLPSGAGLEFKEND